MLAAFASPEEVRVKQTTALTKREKKNVTSII
jgi:hypothetical protein